MVSGSIEPSIFGGPEGSVVKVELSDDSLGLGKAVEGVAREARKGPEGLLDRADRFYQLKETVLPVHTAKRDAKALEIRVAAVRSAAEALQDVSPNSLAAVQMLIADYGRRFQNIDSTINLAMPMIAPAASPKTLRTIGWVSRSNTSAGSRTTWCRNSGQSCLLRKQIILDGCPNAQSPSSPSWTAEAPTCSGRY